MTPNYETISDDDSYLEVWDNDFWIRPDDPCIYPSTETPPVVTHQKALLLKLPDATDTLLPHIYVPVLSFLADSSSYPCPRQDSIKTPLTFSRIPPDSNSHAIVKALKNRSVPPLSAVRDLEMRLGQAWFDGNLSIIDKHYANFPLPFWVISLWIELHFTHKNRIQWASAQERIRNRTVRPTVLISVPVLTCVDVCVASRPVSQY